MQDLHKVLEYTEPGTMIYKVNGENLYFARMVDISGLVDDTKFK